MESGLDSAIDTLKSILEQPDAADTLASLLGAAGLGSKAAQAESAESKKETAAGALGLQPDMLLKVMDAYKSLGSQDKDDRITLLRAIRPFMREQRKDSVDTAIRFLTIFRLMPLLGELKDIL